MLDMESDILTRFYDFPKEKVKDHLRNKQVTPYNNILSYVQAALRILEKLEPLDFFIVAIESNDLLFYRTLLHFNYVDNCGNIQIHTLTR